MLICKFRYYLCLYSEYLDDNTTQNLTTRCDMDNIYHKEKIVNRPYLLQLEFQTKGDLGILVFWLEMKVSPKYLIY